MGKAALVRAEWIKPGAIVIDVGINLVTQEGKSRFVGDVDFHGVLQVASALTPVPGGVGPMTIAYLLVNTVFRQRKYEKAFLLPMHTTTHQVFISLGSIVLQATKGLLS